MNKVAFIDIEGVLIPEIWPFSANKLQIAELKITTRDVTDYQKLVQLRIHMLKTSSYRGLFNQTNLRAHISVKTL